MATKTLAVLGLDGSGKKTLIGHLIYKVFGADADYFE